jgi:hypothetical protein
MLCQTPDVEYENIEDDESRVMHVSNYLIMQDYIKNNNSIT